MKDSVPTIAFLDHTAIWSGGEIALLHLICHLDPSRYRSVVILGQEGPLADRLREKKIETIILPLDSAVGETRRDAVGAGSLKKIKAGLASLQYCLRLRKLLSQIRPDLVQANSLKSDLLGGFAARMAGLPILWNIQDRIADDYLPARTVRVFRKLTRWIPHSIVTNSRATLETLELPESFRDRVKVVHCGVLLPLLQDNPSRTLTVGIIGRLSAWKGQDVFVRSAALILEKFPAARFQIIGGPFFEEEAFAEKLRALIQELGLQHSVELLGFRNDVGDLVQKLDVVVHASTTPEPFGLVIAEAMAAARAVVATNGGGVPEIIEDGVTGMLVPMNDEKAMSQAVGELLSNPEKRSAMGKAARAFAESYLIVDRQAAEMTAFYDQILRRPGSARPRIP